MSYHSSGLWIPPHSSPSNKFTSQDVKKSTRVYLGGRTPYDRLGFRYDGMNHWLNHSRGRMDLFSDVVTKLAVLRARGRVNDCDPVTCTGAVYQDFRGAPKHYQRAHRFVCNPWVGIFTLPDLAFRASTKFWPEMCRPLAVTDIVPNYINYGDSRTEDGMYDAVAAGVKEVIQEQNTGRPVNPKLVDHVVRFRLIPSLREALVQALESVRGKSEEWYENLTQGEPPFCSETLKAMQHESLTSKIDPAKPTEALQSVEDYLWLSLRDAETYQPPSLLTTSVQSEIARLETLADDK